MFMFHKFLEPNSRFTCEVYSDVRDGFIGYSHEHRGPALCVCN